MAEFVKIHGLRELRYAMHELPKRVDRRILNGALRDGAKPMLADAKSHVPVDTGQLKASLMLSTARPRGHTATVLMRVGGATQVMKKRRGKMLPVWVRSKDFPFWALFVERGTSKMSARPFLRPAFERNKRSAAVIIKDRIWAHIQIQAEKLRRKA